MARHDEDDERPVTKMEFVWLMMALKRVDPAQFHYLCAIGECAMGMQAIPSESEIPN